MKRTWKILLAFGIVYAITSSAVMFVLETPIPQIIKFAAISTPVTMVIFFFMKDLR